MNKKLSFLFIFVFLIFIIGGCSDKPTIQTVGDYDLLSISSKSELNKLVKPETSSWWDSWFGRDKSTVDAPAENGDLNESDDSTGDNQNTTSKTNVQVEGVDESDIVKNDSRYIYIANYVGVSVVDTQTEEIYSMKIDGFMPSELFLYENHLIVLGTTYQNINYEPTSAFPDIDLVDYGRCFYYRTYFFKLIILDVNDPANMTIEREFSMNNSYYFQGRMIDGTLYLMLQCYNTYDYQAQEPLIPEYSDSVGEVENQKIDLSQIKVIGGEEHYYSYTHLVSFNVTEKEEPSINSYLGSIQYVYSSKDNLYLTKYARIVNDETPNTDNLYDPSQYQTVIYRFHYQDSQMIYQGKAMVKGYLHNQFSLDEYQGVLRVATTTFTYPEYHTESFVTTFDISDPSVMTKLASLGGMGIDEQIYSSRFNGPIGYIVTFQSIDPLYVIDLSDPANPSVKSELKSPGVSDYLHVINDDLLLGIGRSTTTTQYGNTISTGVKISLFDVSDPNETKEVSLLKVEGDYSYTELQYNHKALLNLPSSQIYAIPVYGYFYDWSNYRQGMYVFHVDTETKSLSYYGLITHSINDEAKTYYYGTNVVRGVIINNILYTISQGYIGINELNEGLTPIKTLTLPQNNQ